MYLHVMQIVVVVVAVEQTKHGNVNPFENIYFVLSVDNLFYV